MTRVWLVVAVILGSGLAAGTARSDTYSSRRFYQEDGATTVPEGLSWW